MKRSHTIEATDAWLGRGSPVVLALIAAFFPRGIMCVFPWVLGLGSGVLEDMPYDSPDQIRLLVAVS